MMLQYADSDDEHDGMMDTDEEVTNGRVTLLNGNGPPYFHGYLYMKGGCMLHYFLKIAVKSSPAFEFDMYSYSLLPQPV